MKLISRFAIAGVAAVMALGGVAAIPASAATCNDSRVCMWPDANYGGTKYEAVYDVTNVGGWVNDQASSLLVGCTSGATFYRDANYSGWAVYFPPCKYTPSLQALTAGAPAFNNWDNEITSHRAGNH